MKNPKLNLDNCNCCAGVELLTPALLNNDHGLSSLDYRVGTHGQFKESMLRGLSDSAILKELTIRENDDSSIALMDVWALILDILSFYNERIINEGYMLTSVERLSLVELAKHISYRPKPGVAANTWLSFLMNDSPGAPMQAKVPIGTSVQSIPEQDEKPQIFENIEEIVARIKWNAIRPKLKQQQCLKKGCTDLYLAGTDTQLKVGDKILFVGEERLNDATSHNWDFRTIDQLVQNDKDNYTYVRWREGLGHNDPDMNPAENARVYAFKQSAALFGYNAPDYRTMSDEVKKSFNGSNWASEAEWDNFSIRSEVNRYTYLDALYPKILTDSWIVFNNSSLTQLYKADIVVASSQSKFALSTKSTKIILDTPQNLNRFQRRETVVWAQSEELQLADAPIFEPVYGKSIELEEAQPDLIKAQKLIVSGELVTHLKVTPRERVVKSGREELVEAQELHFFAKGSSAGILLKTGEILELIAAPHPISMDTTKWFVKREELEGSITASIGDLLPYFETKDSTSITLPNALNQTKIASELIEIEEYDPDILLLKNPLKQVYRRSTLRINGNVAQATHGESKVEVLGSGNAAIPFQKFYLKQKPLSYISSASPSGIESTLEVRVDDIKWKEVSSFYNRSSEERIYISRTEDDGTTYIQFGNGITGTRLPSGQENIRATYRVGIGLDGLLNAKQLSLLLNPQLGIKSVSNPIATSGAEDPEPLEKIRDNAPRTVLSLGRIVSVSDYENFTNAFAGIGKARADLLWKGENRTIHLTVASADEGSVDKDLKKNLIDGINEARHNNYPVIINSFKKKTFNVKAKLKIHPDYLIEKVIAEAKEVLLDAYSFKKRTFAQTVTPSELIAFLQGVDGVIAVDLDELAGQNPFSKAHFRLVSNIARWENQLVKPAELLLIDENNIEITLMN